MERVAGRQLLLSLDVWHAAYEKGIARWNDQRKSVDYANYVVRTTNNAGAAKDLAQVQRGGPTRWLFTMYYSAFGSLYQMFREQMTRAGREGIPGKIKLAAFCFMMFTVQSALEDLVKGRAPRGRRAEHGGHTEAAGVKERGRTFLNESQVL